MNWEHPGLLGFASHGQIVQAHLARGLSMAQALNALVRTVSVPWANHWPRFVASEEQPAHMPYEVFIHQHRAVPTRDNWHDGFNALCWMRWPWLKWHFNRLQAEVIQRDGIGMRRGPVRDALTVFDENGLFLQVPDVLWDAIVTRQWQQAFVEHRALWAQARWAIVGHALLDNLLHPFKGMTAHVLRWPTEWGHDETHLCQTMAEQLSPNVLADKPFVPLPVMGMPGWMAGQDEPGFFMDETVFRPMKAACRSRGK